MGTNTNKKMKKKINIVKKLLEAIKSFDFEITMKDSESSHVVKKESNNFEVDIDQSDLKTNLSYNGKKLSVKYEDIKNDSEDV